jgi:hypothetical protein
MSTALQDFGRAYSIVVTPQSGGQPVTLATTPATPALRVLFEIDIKMGTPQLIYIWQAQVTLYNLTASTANALSSNTAQTQVVAGANIANAFDAKTPLQMGDKVEIAAGYEPTSGTFNAQQNKIYTGNILQAIGTRENVTDTKLTLRLITNLVLAQFAFTSIQRPKNVTDYQVIQQIVSDLKTSIAYIDQQSQTLLSNQTYSRGQVIFDRPCNAFSNICKQNNIFPWIDENGLNLRSFSAPAAAVPSVASTITTYSPPNFGNTPSTPGVIPTILGVPEQFYNGTGFGVTFRVLMDSSVKLGALVAIAAGTAINSYTINYNPQSGQPPVALPNPTGTYIVVGIRHVGDSRGQGDDWYTEITAMAPVYFTQFYTQNGN